MSEKQASSAGRFTGPLRAITPDLNRVPGMAEAKKAAEGALNAVGVVSPHGRRIAAYTGAGLLGVAGLIEWPVAAAGAAAVWLTQPRPKEDGQDGGGSQSRTTTQGGTTAHSGTKTPTGSKAQGGHTGTKTQGGTKTQSRTTAGGTTRTRSQKKTQSASASKSRPAAKSTAKGTARTTAKSTGKATASGTRSRSASGTNATKRSASRTKAS
ncbi:hypothetical protein C3486_03540 [Streptomyces sp. Ru73]|uniref:hypothetical protein n=1 Tax=Streptomyces sp. Ru73 TaxID=2080748 RepID=UPI000CDD29DE|nr:hypothetical protein [Streptomyces sp. Ru73]POX42658.1 hypothetical protein C3486_03540 [Streptomyces sp. Ru73]